MVVGAARGSTALYHVPVTSCACIARCDGGSWLDLPTEGVCWCAGIIIASWVDGFFITEEPLCAVCQHRHSVLPAARIALALLSLSLSPLVVQPGSRPAAIAGPGCHCCFGSMCLLLCVGFVERVLVYQ